MNGVYEKYHENGQLLSTGSYRNGKRNGLWNYFYSDGTIDGVGSYLNDKKNGVWKIFDYDTKKITKMMYKNGVVFDITN